MNQKPLNVLCLAFHTPPEVRPQAILIGKMVPEWIRQGINPTIISFPGEAWPINIPRYSIPQFKPNKYLARIPGMWGILENIYLNKIARFCKKIVKRHKIDLIFSFANPQASNILGMKIKAKTGVKFISHFSDPWYDSEYLTLSKWGAKRLLKKETKIVRSSDRIIFVSEQLKNMVMKKYPMLKEKSRVIPHCYDYADYPTIVKRTSDKFRISYIGAFYKQRNPEILFKALQKMLNQNPELKHKVTIQLVGGANSYAGYSEEKIKDIARLYGLAEITEILPGVSYAESLKLMTLSDCLIVIDADFATSPFLPSKAVDYAASGRPIVGITPTGSTVSEFLRNLGHRSFNYEETGSMAAYLEKLISGSEKPILNKEFLKQFNVQETTKSLIKIFNEIF